MHGFVAGGPRRVVHHRLPFAQQVGASQVAAAKLEKTCAQTIGAVVTTGAQITAAEQGGQQPVGAAFGDGKFGGDGRETEAIAVAGASNSKISSTRTADFTPSVCAGWFM